MKDQYGAPWNYQDFPVSETLDAIEGQNGCTILQFQTATGWTDARGTFPDWHNANISEACAIVPSCTTSAKQWISVGGAQFEHEIVYSCLNVVVPDNSTKK